MVRKIKVHWDQTKVMNMHLQNSFYEYQN